MTEWKTTRFTGSRVGAGHKADCKSAYPYRNAAAQETTIAAHRLGNRFKIEHEAGCVMQPFCYGGL